MSTLYQSKPRLVLNSSGLLVDSFDPSSKKRKATELQILADVELELLAPTARKICKYPEEDIETDSDTDEEVSPEPLQELPNDRPQKVSAGMIVFDWDDTLCPSSWISKFKKGKEWSIPTMFKEFLADFDNLVVCALKTAAALTQYTYIVTNGAFGWVKKSSRCLLPKTHAFLFPKNRTNQSSKIKILSARDKFKTNFSKNGKDWKIDCFNELVIEKIPSKFLMPYLRPDDLPLPRKSLFSLVSIGDGRPEIEAARYAKTLIEDCCLKVVVLDGQFDILSMIAKTEKLVTELSEYFSDPKDFHVSFQ